MKLLRSLAAALVGVTVLTTALPAADAPAKKGPIDPRGRPDERLMDQTMRYYVWHDSEGWHLRSAAKGTVKFEGEIRVVGGEVVKFRDAGLEARGKLADQWGLDEKRQKIRFAINTSSSFDGLDFTVKEATELEFDLRMSGQKRPRRIFIGRDGRNPPDTTFRLPADPDKALGKPAEPKTK